MNAVVKFLLSAIIIAGLFALGVWSGIKIMQTYYNVHQPIKPNKKT
jgi:hypothetical protein